MERKPDGTWHHWGLKPPRRTPPGFGKKEGSWMIVQGIIRKDFQWVPHDIPMPADPPGKLVRWNTNAGYFAAALEKKEN